MSSRVFYRGYNFFYSLQKFNNKSGLSVGLRISISQHSRDILLLEGLIIFFFVVVMLLITHNVQFASLLWQNWGYC